MSDKTKPVVGLTVGDLHLGEGRHSPNEDFKHHPNSIPMRDTRNDRLLDGDMADCIQFVLKNRKAGRETIFRFLGDTFDCSAVELPGKPIATPDEENGVAKIKKIITAHPVFFDALKDFCSAPNTMVKFFTGNHDPELDWPAVQKMIVERISPLSPKKVLFLYEEYSHGAYYRHGEEEPHLKTNRAKPIITATEVSKLLKALKINGFKFAARDVLDVSASHYLTSDLMYHLKKHNYLIGRMHIHDFVWIDAIKHLFTESWYRDRWFFLHGAFHLSRTFYRYVLRPQSWDIEMKLGAKKILRILYWTFTGASDGHTPKDSAMKILRERPEVNCVIYSHEHEYAFEIIQAGGQTKTYINTGTWMPQFRQKKAKLSAPWKRFRQVEKLVSLARAIFGDSELEMIWKCPVIVETIDESGNVSRQLCEWDREKKTLKQMS